MEAIRGVVDIRRKLAAGRPTVFKPNLAISLNNLSVYLLNIGLRDEALEAIREAADIRQKLTADCPAAFNPDLANSLSILSCDLSDAGL